MKGKLIAIVCGSRAERSRLGTYNALDSISPDIVIEGQCGKRGPGGRAIEGIDLFAGEWAQDRGRGLIECPALWVSQDKAAGPIRNEFMAHVALAVAARLGGRAICVAMPGNRGTGSMRRIAREFGIELFCRDAEGRHTHDPAFTPTRA